MWVLIIIIPSGTSGRLHLAKRLREGWERVKQIPSTWFHGRVVEEEKVKGKKSSLAPKRIEISTPNSAAEQPQLLPQDVSVSKDDENLDEDEDEVSEEWSLKQVLKHY